MVFDNRDAQIGILIYGQEHPEWGIKVLSYQYTDGMDECNGQQMAAVLLREIRTTMAAGNKMQI
jgi:hypothetical protein